MTWSNFWGGNILDKKLSDNKYKAVLFVGMPFAFERPKECLKILEQLINDKKYVFFGTYFPTSHKDIPKIAKLGVRIGVGDAGTAFFGINLTEKDTDWMKVSAFIERNPNIYRPDNYTKALEEAAIGFQHCMVQSEDPKSKWTIEKLIESVASGTAHEFKKYAKDAIKWTDDKAKCLNMDLSSPVIIVKNFKSNNLRGRHLYPVLDKVIENQGLYFGSSYAPRFPYVIAYQEYKSIYHVLFHTYVHCTVYPSLYFFLPSSISDEDIIGPKKAFWLNFGKKEMDEVIKEIIKNAKDFLEKHPII